MRRLGCSCSGWWSRSSRPTVSRFDAGVWTSGRFPAGADLRGIAHVRLRARQQSGGTVVAYLDDVDAFGTGRLITHQPATWTVR
ncbi:MAG: acyl esterase [Mycobacterium sp.]|nr:acyl esterase [Mycobacterium sp.]